MLNSQSSFLNAQLSTIISHLSTAKLGIFSEFSKKASQKVKKQLANVGKM
jgi:hypothetical protein